ncbi:MAG: hypothetical protein CM15mP57_0010 [Alphaproteobacteria bacterium]|nr:MAG: hypothetical protein CM15mP57_0010 [Alphaproteobacteria bacterium]
MKPQEDDENNTKKMLEETPIETSQDNLENSSDEDKIQDL